MWRDMAKKQTVWFQNRGVSAVESAGEVAAEPNSVVILQPLDKMSCKRLPTEVDGPADSE
jgi:hypothetical protein